MAAAVPADDGGVLHTEAANRISVDQDVMGRDRETADRPSDGEDGGVIDVDPVDLSHGCRADPDPERALADPARERLALATVELLGVVDTADGARVGGHHDGTCDDGARQGAPSDLIDPGEQRTARLAQIPLERAPAARHARGEPSAAYSAAGAPVWGTDTFALRSLMRVALPVR